MKQVDFAGLAIEATSGTPIVVLREQAEPHRILPIFIGGPEALAIAAAVNGEVPPRPLTHDLMAALVRGLDGHLDAVEVTELSHGSFLASLALHGPTGEQRIDTRPSDGIALAVRLGAPLFVSDEVLDEAGTLPADVLEQRGIDATAEPVDAAAIDSAVEEFRSFLEEIDPQQFTDPSPDGSGNDIPENS
jgi:uncharacterized protein